MFANEAGVLHFNALAGVITDQYCHKRYIVKTYILWVTFLSNLGAIVTPTLSTSSESESVMMLFCRRSPTVDYTGPITRRRMHEFLLFIRNRVIIIERKGSVIPKIHLAPLVANSNCPLSFSRLKTICTVLLAVWYRQYQPAKNLRH